MSNETPEMPQKACKFCEHCKRIGDGALYQCRYNPPRPGGFPTVKWNDWCRCYKPNEPLIKKHLSRKDEERARIQEVRNAIERKG
jgi:hypothetical protein